MTTTSILRKFIRNSLSKPRTLLHSLHSACIEEERASSLYVGEEHFIKRKLVTSKNYFLYMHHGSVCEQETNRTQTWEPWNLKVMRAIFKPDFISVDIGANVGINSIYICQNLVPQGMYTL